MSPKIFTYPEKKHLWITWISYFPCCNHPLWIFSSYIIITPGDRSDTWVKQRSSMDNNTHTLSMVCVLWATLYKYTILTCARILFVSDWGLQIKDYNMLFSKWCDTIHLSGKQNHLQQDEALAMLKLICTLLQSCNNGRFDQTEICTAPERGLLNLFNRYWGCKGNYETFFHKPTRVERWIYNYCHSLEQFCLLREIVHIVNLNTLFLSVTLHPF